MHVDQNRRVSQVSILRPGISRISIELKTDTTDHGPHAAHRPNPPRQALRRGLHPGLRHVPPGPAHHRHGRGHSQDIADIQRDREVETITAASSTAAPSALLPQIPRLPAQRRGAGQDQQHPFPAQEVHRSHHRQGRLEADHVRPEQGASGHGLLRPAAGRAVAAAMAGTGPRQRRATRPISTPIGWASSDSGNPNDPAQPMRPRTPAAIPTIPMAGGGQNPRRPAETHGSGGQITGARPIAGPDLRRSWHRGLRTSQPQAIDPGLQEKEPLQRVGIHLQPHERHGHGRHARPSRRNCSVARPAPGTRIGSSPGSSRSRIGHTPAMGPESGVRTNPGTIQSPALRNGTGNSGTVDTPSPSNESQPQTQRPAALWAGRSRDLHQD